LKKSSLTFLKVHDNASKLQAVLSTIQRLFRERKRVLISVPNSEAAQYLDEILWKMPPESFIPHAIVNQNCDELVAITTLHANFNKATVLINLCPTISPLTSQFEQVFDLDDQTHPSKAKLTAERKQAYNNLERNAPG